MTRRPAVTLIEVLIAMFIMAIGMLALLVLFPLGAVSMAQALKDDRCASTAAMAENVAIATSLRYDTSVTTSFGASSLVYVDPYGVLGGLGAVGGVVPRISPSFITSSQLTDRFFSLPDDITFSASGRPDLSSTLVDRGRRYSYAYLLRQLSPGLIQLYVVVYSGRPVNSMTPEPTLSALGNQGGSSITLAATGTTVKRGGWVMDTSSGTSGFLYRVTNLAEAGANTTIDVQPNLISNVSQITILENVAEVFDKGTGWQL